MKICSICKKISGSGEDHLDCKEKRRVELEDTDTKLKLLEKLDLSKNSGDLGIEVKAILEHLTKEKEKNQD